MTEITTLLNFSEDLSIQFISTAGLQKKKIGTYLQMMLKYKFLMWIFTSFLCFVVQDSHSLPTHLEDTFTYQQELLTTVFWIKTKN